MLLEVDMPVEKFNAAVKDGTVGEKIGSILEDAQPSISARLTAGEAVCS
jgi:hypothetical protein